jgi:prepilin-type processing-associated H-X9-DG protein
MSCGNNLKQLALGVMNFESSYQKFPPAGRNYGWCRNPAQYGDPVIKNSNGWLEVLPYLEQENLHRAWNQNQAVSNCMTGNEGCCPPVVSTGTLAGDAVNSGNGNVAATKVSVFRCPADGGDPLLGTDQYYGIKAGSSLRGVKNNYDFCVLANYDCNYWKRQSQTSRRMFGENSDCRVADVTDGTSNTIMLAEMTYDVYNGECNPWAYRGWVQTGIDPGTSAINNWTWSTITPRTGQLGSWSRMGSWHTGGAQAAMADGSVRFFSESTDVTVLGRLAAMADGSTVNLP